MSIFFKRSKKLRGSGAATTANDRLGSECGAPEINREHRAGEGDENRLIEVATKSRISPMLTAQSTIKASNSKQQPCENAATTSVGERLSNFVQGIFGEMAKGNRRSKKGKSQQQQLQNQSQTFLQSQLRPKQKSQLPQPELSLPPALPSTSPPPPSKLTKSSTSPLPAPPAHSIALRNLPIDNIGSSSEHDEHDEHDHQTASNKKQIINNVLNNHNNINERNESAEQSLPSSSSSSPLPFSHNQQILATDDGRQPVESEDHHRKHHRPQHKLSPAIPFESNEISTSNECTNLEQGYCTGSIVVSENSDNGVLNENTSPIELVAIQPLTRSHDFERNINRKNVSTNLVNDQASLRNNFNYDDCQQLNAKKTIMGQQSTKQQTKKHTTLSTVNTQPYDQQKQQQKHQNEDIFYEASSTSDYTFPPTSNNNEEFLLASNDIYPAAAAAAAPVIIESSSNNQYHDDNNSTNIFHGSFPLISSVAAASAANTRTHPFESPSSSYRENESSTSSNSINSGSTVSSHSTRPNVQKYVRINSGFSLSDIEEEEYLSDTRNDDSTSDNNDDDDNADGEENVTLDVNGAIADISTIFEQLQRQEQRRGTRTKEPTSSTKIGGNAAGGDITTTTIQPSAFFNNNNNPIDDHTLNHTHNLNNTNYNNSASASVNLNLKHSNNNNHNINRNGCSKYFNDNDEQNVILFNEFNERTTNNTNENNLLTNAVVSPGTNQLPKQQSSNQMNQINVLYCSDIEPNCVKNECGSVITKKKNCYTDDTMSLPDIVESIGSNVASYNLNNSNNNVCANTVTAVRGEPCGAADNDCSRSDCSISSDNDDNSIDQSDDEGKLVSHVNEAETNALNCQTKVNDLSYQINELERNLTIKTWNIDRLQSEIQAAYKESDCVRMKLKLQEEDLIALRAKMNDAEDAHNIRYNDLESRYTEQEEKLAQMQKLAIGLQVQLAEAQCDAADMRAVRDRLVKEFDEEKQALQDALDAAIIDRAEIEARWQRDFEQLRTVNSDREEHLLQDCEWKLRKTERSCKDRVVEAERTRTEAIERMKQIEKDVKKQLEEVQHLRSNEAEVAQLRGLTNEQSESINSLTEQIEELKERLEEETGKLAESLQKIEKITFKYTQDLGDRDRQMNNKLEEARCDVACIWEDRLMNEMLRLKVELESCYAEDRSDALRHAHEEYCEELSILKESFNFKEKLLKDEIDMIKVKLADRNRRLEEANEKADKQIMQIRLILDKAERDHQREIDVEISLREEQMKALQVDYDSKETGLRDEFNMRWREAEQRFTEEVKQTKADLTIKFKKDYEQQLEKARHEKMEAVQELERVHKRRMADADTRMEDVEIIHQREIKDLQNSHSMERCSLEQRDRQNLQEIETLHRKCRCLTKLFEEMRMRYERRDPRPEDVRQIEELKSLIESQDKDLRRLTEALREMQICQQLEEQNQPYKPQRKSKKSKLNCDVIYEENEERDSPISIGENEEIK